MKINRVFIFFLVAVVLVFSLFYQGIQSERFALFLSKKITSVVYEQLGFTLEFKRIDVSVIPPGTILRKVNIKKVKSKNFSLSINTEQVGVYFDILDLFRNQVTISQLFLQDARFSYVRLKKKSQTSQFDYKKDVSPKLFYKIYKKEIINKIPYKIKKVKINNLAFEVEDVVGYASSISGEIGSDFHLSFSLEDVKHKKNEYFDSIVGKIILSPKKLLLENVELRKEFEKSLIDGNVVEQKSKKNINVNIITSARIEELKRLITFPENFKDLSGYIESKISLSGDLDNIKSSLQIKNTTLASQYVFIDDLELNIDYEKPQLKFNKIKIKLDDGVIETSAPVAINLAKVDDFYDTPLKVSLNNVKSEKIFSSFKESLSPLKGRLNGDLIIFYNKKRVLIKILKNFHLRNYKLSFNENNPFMSSDIVKFNDANFEYDFSTSALTSSYIFKLNETMFSGQGYLKGPYIEFSTGVTNLDFTDIGPLGGIEIKGRGSLFFRVSQVPNSDAKMSFEGDLKQFSILGINTKSLKAKINYNLSNGKFKIDSFKGQSSNTDISGRGVIDFDKEKINLVAQLGNSNFADLKEIVPFVFEDSAVYLEKVGMNFNSSIYLDGGLDATKLRVKGSLDGKNINFYNEDFEAINLKYDYLNGKISLSDIQVLKGQGRIFGSLSIDNIGDLYTVNLRSNGIKLRDFYNYKILNLGLDGELDVSLFGNGNSNDFSSKLSLGLVKSSVGNKTYKNSKIVFFNNYKDIYLSANIFGDLLTLDSYLNIESKNKKESFAKLKIKTDDIKELFAVISPHNFDDRELKGYLDLSLSSVFNIFDYSNLDLNLNINELFFYKSGINFSLIGPENVISISKGKINKWSLLLNDGENRITSVAEGNITSSARIVSEFATNAKILELLSPLVSSTNGQFEGRLISILNKKELSNNSELKANDLSLRLKNLPGYLSDTEMDIYYSEGDIIVNRFKGKYGNGDFNLTGKVKVDQFLPEVDLFLSLDKIHFSVLDNSNVVISANTRLVGDKLPYQVKGDLQLIHAIVNDEFPEIVNHFQSNNDLSIKYLPIDIAKKDFSFIDYEISFLFEEALLLQNSLADLRFVGKGRFFGHDNKLKVRGEMSSVERGSKFMFKGHEFMLSKGTIDFDIINGSQEVGVVLEASSQINDFSIILDLVGSMDNLNVNIRSDPPLPQEDILSLLALGVTVDDSKDMQAQDLQSVTSIGIGSILMDQFGLNKGLKKSLGVKVSVHPELSDEDVSPMTGRLTSGDTLPSKVRSGTKIRLRKTINKVDFSFSSTLGGSLEQKQEMNLNYNIDKNFSVQGVYEMRTNTDVESTQSPDSAGVDIIWKKTFK